MREGKENKVRNFLKDGNAVFLATCAAVQPPYAKPSDGIPPTRRQASKWLMGKGIAYKTHKRIV